MSEQAAGRPLCPEKGCIHMFVRPNEGAPFAVHVHYEKGDEVLPDLIDYCAKTLREFREKKVGSG